MILCMNWNLKMIKDSSCFFPSVSKIHTFNCNFENENKIVTTAIVVTAISKKWKVDSPGANSDEI